MLDRALQKPEESVRRPVSIDDTRLLSITDNAQRLNAAEVAPVTLADTIDALASQFRQMLYGTVIDGNWCDVPPVTLSELRIFLDQIGTTQWASEEEIQEGQPVYVTSTGGVRVADRRNRDIVTLAGLATHYAPPNSTVLVKHSGHLFDTVGLIPGKLYFVGYNGELVTDIAESGSGEAIARVGISQSATKLLIDIKEIKYR